MRTLSAGLALALLAGCAPRIEVVDAINGAPLEARLSTLASGNVLVEANGYEMWSGPAQPRVALHPLWIRRFADERMVPRRDPPPPCAGCPGTRAK